MEPTPTMRQISLIFAATISILAAMPAGAANGDSAASAWSVTDQMRLRLVSASTTAGNETRLGLEFEMKPGWKVYWRSPGDAGFPPSIDWQGSRNLKAAEFMWPVPHRFSVQGLETLGYKNSVVFPIAARAEDATAGLDVHARVRYLACDDICIPYEAKLALALPAGVAHPSAFAHLIDKYAAQVPSDGKAHGLSIERLTAISAKTAGNGFLRVVAHADLPFEAPDAFLEGSPVLAYAKPSVKLSDGGRLATIDIEVNGLDLLEDAPGKTLTGRQFTVTLADGARSAEKRLAALAPTAGEIASDALPTGAISAPAAMAKAPSFWVMALLAVLGGLILNLMPCVLPVLSLKMLSLVKHGGGHERDVRLGFMASAAGIIATFLVLAGVLATLRSAGTVIGWGIQFQQPWFLTTLVLLVTIFACNLWGFFEVRLPAFVSDLGGGAAHVHGLGGHFLGGAFATLLATPCTAPFLGTAVGFALAGSVVDMLAIFAALGIGLSLPYLLVAAFPRLATWLPRPGPWMIRLKAVLGLLLAGTGVWLIYVLAGVAGTNAATAIGVVAVIAAGLLFLSHRGSAGARLSVPGLVALGFLALALPSWLPTAPDATASKGSPGESAALKSIWRPFDPAAIPALVASGKTVFVDVTADWCITCQVNKRVVLAQADMLARLKGENVVAMQADWTRPSDAIAGYLARYGRFGIPFNAVYGPKAPDGIVLPELLNTSAVLDALAAAGTPAALATRQ
jgi:suppressor for copper-sensitivity B